MQVMLVSCMILNKSLLPIDVLSNLTCNSLHSRLFLSALKRYGDKISKTLAIEGKQSELHELLVKSYFIKNVCLSIDCAACSSIPDFSQTLKQRVNFLLYLFQ